MFEILNKPIGKSASRASPKGLIPFLILRNGNNLSDHQ